ncbi:pyridoxamine 5'-phosphate oxidase family protein [Gordonia sp. (in: high G+C Gram-positive bacteria)]|uniref:pyridoxamine 5'-phosphate oxidase family protein n=1 Tax=Gordonia sp. (in: high G+C Gram-positive bacteria) TaxID=84139 RepID=UPI003C774EB1
MSRTTADLSAEALQMLSEYHLASLATVRANGTPHVVAVGFTFDAEAGKARVITFEGSQKVRNADRGGYGALTHVDGPRWLTFEGPMVVKRDAVSVADGEARYAARYRKPQPNPKRVVLEMSIERVLGSAGMFKSTADAPS